MANPIQMPALPEFFYEEEWVDLCEKIIATNANGANNNQKFLSIILSIFLNIYIARLCEYSISCLVTVS